MKDKFAFFEAYQNPTPKRRRLLAKRPFLLAKRALLETSFKLDRVSFSTPEDFPKACHRNSHENTSKHLHNAPDKVFKAKSNLEKREHRSKVHKGKATLNQCPIFVDILCLCGHISPQRTTVL